MVRATVAIKIAIEVVAVKCSATHSINSSNEPSMGTASAP